jgi:hypothetical protein
MALRPPDYFPPADTGDIIGTTGPGYSFDDLSSGYQNPVFTAPITWGDLPEPEPGGGPWAETTPYEVNPRNPFETANQANQGINWKNVGKKILDIFSGGQGQKGALPAIARILEGLSKGRAQGRITEAEMARLYDYLNLARTRTFYDRAAQELDQRKFLQDLQERSFGNATKARYLQALNPQTSRIMAPPELRQFQGTGGTSIADISQADRDEIGGTMYRNAITELLDPLQPGTATSGRRLAALPEPEAISPTPEAGAFDSILNWASIIAGGLSGARGGSQPPAQTPTTTPQPAQPPEAIPPRRSNSTLPTAPGQAPAIGDVNLGAPGRAELSTTPRSLGSSGPYDTGGLSPASGLNASAGLTTGLPSIAGLVPPVPEPTSPLSPYDPYGRLRGRRL